MRNPYATNVGLYLADGTTDGLVAADVKGWGGRLIKAPRTHLEDLCARGGMEGPGVFLLVGADASGRPLAFVGHAAHVGAQVMRHDEADRGRGFWDTVAVVVSKDGGLGGGRAHYLAAQLAVRIRMRGVVRLMSNDVAPDSLGLPSGEASPLMEYVRVTMLLLPLLGMGLEEKSRGSVGRGPAAGTAPVGGRAGGGAGADVGVGTRARSVSRGTGGFSSRKSPVFHRRVAGQRIDAHMQVVDGRHMVLEGSIIPGAITVKRRNATGDFGAKVAELQQRFRQLERDGDIVRLLNGMARVTRGIPFTSASSAAAFVDGRGSANGRDEWVDDSGTTYGNWASGH